VAGVGTRSKKVTYGINRADYSFIAGGVVPGVLLLKPDFLENKEDWPFLWGENECVINICADYIFLAHAQEALVSASRVISSYCPLSASSRRGVKAMDGVADSFRGAAADEKIGVAARKTSVRMVKHRKTIRMMNLLAQETMRPSLASLRPGELC